MFILPVQPSRAGPLVNTEMDGFDLGFFNGGDFSNESSLSHGNQQCCSNCEDLSKVSNENTVTWWTCGLVSLICLFMFTFY